MNWMSWRTEMALSVLAYNLTRVMNIIGIRPRPLVQAMGHNSLLSLAGDPLKGPS